MQIKISDISTQRVFLGWTGENKHVQFAYDFSEIFAEYPDAGVGLTIKPPTGDAYPHTITRDGNTVLWEILASDCAVVGDGVYQFAFTQGETVAKSLKGFYTVKESLTGSGEAPTPVQNWIADAEAALFSLTGMTARAETLAPGSSATASIVTENGRKVIIIGVPTGLKGDKGDKGDTGATPVLTIGTVTTLAPDAEAYVTITGTPDAPVLNIGIPQGVKGDKGDKGAKGDKGDTGATPDFSIGTVSTLSPDASATASITGTPENPVLNLGIPQGVQGIQGQRGEKGEKGDQGSPGDPTELIDDNAGVGVSTKVWSAGKSATELNSVMSAINELEPNVDSLEINKADVIINTASGSIASFSDGADGMPVKELTVAIEPVQDLHGQDAPYPPGSRKNKFNIKDLWDNGTTVSNGNTESVRYIRISVPNGTYTCSTNCPNNTTATIASVFITNTYTDAPSSSASGVFLNAPRTLITSDEGYLWIYIRVQSQTYLSWNEQSFAPYYIQVESGSTATSYSPYSNICPITGWTGANVTRTGKNLLDKSSYSRLNNQVIMWGGGATGGADGSFVLAPGTYTFSCEEACNGLYVYNSTDRIAVVYNQTAVSFTISEITPIKLHAYISNSSTSAIYAQNYQLELGSAASSYEAFQGSTYPITFPSEAGTVYGGSLTVNEDGTGKLVLNGVKDILTVANGMLQSEYFTESTGQTVAVLGDNVRISLNRKSQSSNMNTVSNTYQHIMANLCPHYFAYAVDSAHWYINNQLYLFLPVSDVGETVESFKNYLATNPFEVYVQLATPITYTLTALEVLETLKGVNNIWADCGAVEVTYRADTKLYIDNRITQAIAAALNA